MNIHHELTALRMAGISSRLLSRPVLILAILFSCISYINLQFFYPGALNFKNNFKDTYIKKTKYKNLHPNVIYLNDNSKLVFQKFNRNKKKLFDVFFIKNNEDIYHAKYLDLNSSPPIGKFVDFLSRKDSYFEKINSFDEYEFTEINIQNGQYSLFIPYLNRSISMLLSQYKNLSFSKKDKIEILSYLNYKLAMPLLSVLLIIFVFPSLLHFSKNISIFFICAISIFGYIIFHTVMDSALILAENSLFSPYVIIWSPIVLSFYLGIRKYIKA
ncbi:MAG: hypothetical protein A3F40_02260 [Chlamydiae bacterium RIFCSPHIGHO2_12_FULL_27_8]|nr:MAG: hypothetical protein A3F40_02260 [Chlamydiae bacterium RIFCSPHIGHO2_12_FULL_27_8]